MIAPLFDPENARDRLLAGAARLFHRKGYATATVREIGAEVGILSGSLFHHVRSKEDILFQVMDRVITAMLGDLEQALDQADTPHARLRALIQIELAYLHGPAADATAVLFHDWRALSEDRRAVLLAGRDAYFALWHQVLTDARAKGLIHADPMVARQLLHGALAWTSYWFRPGGTLDLAGLTDQTLALIVPPTGISGAPVS